jgi:cell shape-determining protein MreC
MLKIKDDVDLKENPIRDCIDLSKRMIGTKKGIIYYTESFRIDFENRMSELSKLKTENEKLKQRLEENQKIF